MEKSDGIFETNFAASNYKIKQFSVGHELHHHEYIGRCVDDFVSAKQKQTKWRNHRFTLVVVA